MRLSLGLVLAVCLAGLQFIAVITVVTSSYVTSEKALLTHARDLLSDVAANTIEHSRGFLTPAEGAAELATRLAESDIVASDDPQLLEKLLFHQLKTAPQFAGVFYGDEAGNFVYVMRSEGPGPFRSKLVARHEDSRNTRLIWRDTEYEVIKSTFDLADTYDPRKRPWYQNVREQLVSVWTDPYIFFTSQKPGITVASPVFGQSGELQGVIGVDIEIAAISDFLSQLRVGNHGKALILNKNGDVIAHPNSKLIKTENEDGTLRFMSIDEIKDPIARAAFGHLSEAEAVSVDREITTVFEFEGANYVSTVTPIMSEALPWTIAVFAPEDDFIGGIKKNRTQNIGVAAAIAALTAAVGLVLANLINKPLRALAVRATQISQGKYAEPAPVPSAFREIRQANETINLEVARRQKSEAEYTFMFDLGSRGMAEISPGNGQFIRVNAKFAEILGFTEVELLDMTVDQVSHTGAPSVFRNILDAVAVSSQLPRERQFVRKNGSTVWILINAIMTSDEEGRPLHSIITIDDITETKSAEAQIRTLNQDLSHSARLNTMGQMAAGLAHELNQPLTAITQSVDAALITAKDLELKDPELVEILSEVDQQAHRAGDIIRALRGFIRKDEGADTAFDLTELINQTVGLVGAEAKEQDVTITVERAKLPMIHGVRVQIAQVLVNLMHNAIEAISTTQDTTRHIKVTTKAQNDKVIISVIDTGPGVDPKISLFNEFQTTKQSGMGLGLSISRTIVESHGGELWYEPATPKGGNFSFTLPIGEDHA